ncbi:hypothetical protein THII_2009 [Thioploca ingrica]|uniref:Uncharacterized protein n=1 Tax=Thioploca ingrica TaxID=40754 RepID=A0A090BV63_9GAMM|nr:hypothetical protein THII_2009 [Thioploca ingrica]
MGKISPDTFNQSKQYVNVRLQQGVPIVDADWNEMDDIRKHEHQTFIRTVVGDGVPKGSNSFQIEAADLENDFRILGGTPEQPGLCLVDGWEIQTTEASLTYTAQPLYNNAELATKWQVAPLALLTTPATDRVDIVYLDAWERLVDSTDDPDLLNPLIGIETCLRRKREWVVRVAEGTPLPPPPAGHAYYPLARLTRPAGQASISAEQLTDLRKPMAMARQSDVEQIAVDAFGSNYTLDQDGQPNLKISLRAAINALLRGTIPTTPVTILTTATFVPPTANYQINAMINFTDSQQASWVFWSTSGYDQDKQVNKASMWYKRYDPSTQQWEPDQELSTVEQSYGNNNFQPLEDPQGNIWLFWETYRNVNGQWRNYIYGQRYLRAKQQWEGEQPLTDDKTDNSRPVAIKDLAGNIWVFWYSYRQMRDGQWNYDIYYRRYTGSWEAEQRLTTATEDDYYPTAAVDSQGNIWVFWQSYRQIGDVWNSDIYYKIYYTSQQWSGESRITYDAAYDEQPLAFTTSRGEIWVFWLSNRTGSQDIWYRRNWGSDIQLNTGTAYPGNYRVIEDRRGDIWVFWSTGGGRGDDGGGQSEIFYKHYSGAWGLTTSLTTNGGNYFSATASYTGDIWTFVAQNHDIQHQQLIAVI